MPNEWLTTRPTEPGWYKLRWAWWSCKQFECCQIYQDEDTQKWIVSRLLLPDRYIETMPMYDTALWQKIEMPEIPKGQE